MTVKQQIEQIQKKENGRFHQVYVVSQTRKNIYASRKIIDGQMHHAQWLFLNFAQNKELELNKEVKDLIVKSEKGVSVSLSLQSDTFSFNQYFIVIERLANKNKARSVKKGETWVLYKGHYTL